MRPKRYIVVAVTLGVMSLSSMSQALAFEETTVGSGEAKAPALELPKALPKGAGEPDEGLKLSPGLHIGQTPGTEVHVPGLGKVGVLPKLDFGLELLYGANEEEKVPFQDNEATPDDVQLRGTIKHRF